MSLNKIDVDGLNDSNDEVVFNPESAGVEDKDNFLKRVVVPKTDHYTKGYKI